MFTVGGSGILINLCRSYLYWWRTKQDESDAIFEYLWRTWQAVEYLLYIWTDIGPFDDGQYFL